MNSADSVAGTLTLYKTDGSILGELSDADMEEEHSSAGSNWVFSGLASDGTLDDLVTFLDGGNDTVRYVYKDSEAQLSGDALVLKPSTQRQASGTKIRVETAAKPSRA